MRRVNPGMTNGFDERGAAMVEFAFIAPLLLLVLAGIIDGAQLLINQNAMHNGVMSASQYIMRGGNNLSTAKAIGYSAWSGHSSSASVDAQKACYCGGAAGDCSSLCTDGTVPEAAVTISASDTVPSWFAPYSISAQQQVRVR
ncbi:pilus assembly protein [Asticcacaulis sp. EMRT-3]|uniref:TadE/TadG family type IV pilus assembly protein n=1 Tax=Asticcacaulis sp. EMRT-3 TaxID=3040349 RepID=UPI0024AF6DA6|nr:pilus assembly protein [Asticcacaulis sp. EMRT-3]MDI7776561.1 pilus assembly protein [Asticcacaulis sp. EMRT-3]